MTKYTIKYTGQFKKDYKLALRRHLDIQLLEDVISMLAQGIPLPEQYRDHTLTGNWNGYRECHIQPDWLLIYYFNDEILVLTLTRTGSHSDLFNK